MSEWWYWTVYWTVRTIFSIYCRIETRGFENLPLKGPLMLVLNHKSFADPPMAAVLLRRRVFFMAKIELFRFRPFGWLIASVGAFPVTRGRPDRKAIRRSLEILNNGLALMIFPEGHRSDSGDLQQARSGAVFLAQKTGCQVVPIGISGQYGFRKTIRYSMGEPFVIPPEMPRDSAQVLVMERIAAQMAVRPK